MNYIKHVGVKGMKWGIRKAIERVQSREASTQRDMASLARSRDAGTTSDRARFRYRSKPLQERVGMAAVSRARAEITGEFIKALMNDKKSLLMNPTPKGFLELAKKIASKTVSDVVIKDAMAKSAARKYDKSGKKIKGKNESSKCRHCATFTSLASQTLSEIASSKSSMQKY